MQSKPAAAFHHTVTDLNVIGLLEANAVAAVILHDAVRDDGVVAAVEKDAGGPAAVDF
jgi:hypothetical protein